MFVIVAFASAADLATYMQRDLSAADTASANLALDLATAAIQSYTGQTISTVAGDTITLDPPCGSRLFLPELPVTAVTSITIAGTLLSTVTPDYYWYADTGSVLFASSRWAVPQSVVVVYSHGYAVIPEPIRAVCIELAAAMLNGAPTGDAAGISDESIGNYSVSYDTATRTLRDIADGRLDRYRVPVMA